MTDCRKPTPSGPCCLPEGHTAPRCCRCPHHPSDTPLAPRLEDIARAIATIEDSRQTHVEWIDYLARHGDDLRPHEEIAGDAGHHRETVEQYEQVLSVLRASAAPVPEGVPEGDPVKAFADGVRAGRERLVLLLQRLRPHLAHDYDCATYNLPGPDPCSCGLAGLLVEIPPLSDTPHEEGAEP